MPSTQPTRRAASARKPAVQSPAPAQPAPAEGGPAARILAAARELLFASGMAGLTTDRLARLAGVSKTSIYKYFPDPAQLLDAVVAQEAARISHDLPQEPGNASAFWESLRRYGTNLLTLLNRPDVIRLDQLIHEQACARPGLGRRFFDATYGRSLREIRAMLVYGAERGFIRGTVDVNTDAELLLSMWAGFALVRARLGIVQRPFPDPRAWSAACVNRLYPADVR
jgi:AcrR family transcriptional regulator